MDTKKLGGIALGIATFLIISQVDKLRKENATNKEYLTICAGDTDCLKAVDAHFDECFNDSFTRLSRKLSSVNTSNLTQCINNKTGTTHVKQISQSSY